MKNPKSILITGASSGIGAALALHYANPEITLFIGGQNKKRLEEVKESCERLGAKVYTKQIDVKDQKQMSNWIKSCDKKQALDLVFANAGVSAGPGNDIIESEKMTRNLFDVNIIGVLNTVFPALTLMRKRNKGQIAITSSLTGYKGLPSAPAYSATKNAVRAWGEALRGAFLKTGIEINVICPGFVKSRITAKNKFPMPFLMEGEKAAKIIAKGLAKNKARITFPLILAFVAWIMGCLPASLSDFILSRLPKKGA
ncbi:MAG: SDR family NAD(P)-dependent oxidoreductase [Alphaproteobacteria bacterium]|nr:SDR family NAD(P)-dependent oxidoreductase [Alphaproteobacteria bacterium]